MEGRNGVPIDFMNKNRRRTRGGPWAKFGQPLVQTMVYRKAIGNWKDKELPGALESEAHNSNNPCHTVFSLPSWSCGRMTTKCQCAPTGTATSQLSQKHISAMKAQLKLPMVEEQLKASLQNQMDCFSIFTPLLVSYLASDKNLATLSASISSTVSGRSNSPYFKELFRNEVNKYSFSTRTHTGKGQSMLAVIIYNMV